VVALASYAIIYFGAALASPSFFLEKLSGDGPPRGPAGESDHRTVPFWPFKIGLAWASTGTLLWHASSAFTDFIPSSWGGWGENGQWNSFREQARLAVAIFGAIVLLMTIQRASTALYKAQRRSPDE
jgi:hypothetical protein